MTWVRKWLIRIHRYLGMALSLLLAVWFVSGIAMIYARGMPRLTPDVRLKRLPPIDLASVRRTPTQALEKSQLDRPGRTTLLTVMGRPAYRFGGRDAVTVFADTGELLEIVGETEALKIASGFMNLPESQFHAAHALWRGLPPFLTGCISRRSASMARSGVRPSSGPPAWAPS